MNIVLPDEFQEFVRDEVAVGHYGSPEELLRAALKLLRDRDRHLEELRREIQIGIDEAERGELHDSEEFFNALNARVSEQNKITR